MPTVWITYAWDDNKDYDVDFLAQELQRTPGVEVKLDRWNLNAGRRLWEQVANFITNAAESQAWILYATQNSLASEPCREELAYALDRALNARGGDFPIIAIFPSSIDGDLIPPSIRVRLFISLADPDWKERTVAAIERRPVALVQETVKPYVARPLAPAPSPFKYVLEVRPRAGVWNPFIFAVPVQEQESVGMALRSGPPGRIPPVEGVVFSRGQGVSDDGKWQFSLGYEAATPTNSYYAFLREMPSKLAFGEEGGGGTNKVWLFKDVRFLF